MTMKGINIHRASAHRIKLHDGIASRKLSIGQSKTTEVDPCDQDLGHTSFSEVGSAGFPTSKVAYHG